MFDIYDIFQDLSLFGYVENHSNKLEEQLARELTTFSGVASDSKEVLLSAWLEKSILLK